MALGGVAVYIRFALVGLVSVSNARPQGEPVITPQGPSIPSSWLHPDTTALPALGTIPNFPEPGQTISSNCGIGYPGESNPQTYSYCFFRATNESFPTTHASFSPHSIANQTTTPIDSTSASPTIPPECSQFCFISADEVRVIYWPTPYATPTVEAIATASNNFSAAITPPPPNPSTIVSDGFTFISPSVYLVYTGLVAQNDIWGMIGSTYNNLTLGYDPSILSTVNYCNTCGLTQSFDFQDFNKPPRWSVISEQYGCAFFGHSYSTALLPKSHPPSDFVTDYNDLSEWIGFSSAGDAQSWELKPIVDLPPGLTDLDPAWKQCSRWTGVWDPPRPLVSIAGLDPVSAQPEPASMPGPVTTPARPVMHTPVSAMPPASPEQLAAQTPNPQTVGGNDPVDPGISSQQGAANQAPASQPNVNGDGSAQSTDPQLDSGSGGSNGGREGGSSQSEDPGSNPAILDSPARKPPSQDPPTQDLPVNNYPAQNDPVAAKVSVPYVAVTPIHKPASPALTMAGLPAVFDNSGNVAIGSSTLSPGGPAMTAAGTTVSVLPGNGKPVATPKPADSPAKPVVGIVAAGKTWTPAGSDAVAAGEQTLSVGGSSADVGGTPISLHADGLVAGPSTLALPVNDKVPVAWTAAGQTFTKLDDNTVVAGGRTLAVGSVPQVIGGQTMSLASGGIVAGSSTVAIPTFDPPSTNGAPVAGATFAVAGKTFTPIASGSIVVQGVTISPSGEPLTVNGQVISLDKGGLVVDGSTFAVPVATPTDIGRTIVAAGHTFTSLAPTAVALDGQTIISGGPAQTVHGEIVSLGDAGLVVGSSTISLPTATPASRQNVFTIGGKIVTSLSPTLLAVDGVTITSGSHPKTVEGATISWGASGLVIDESSTIGLPTVLPSGVAGGSGRSSGSVDPFGSLILEGFGHSSSTLASTIAASASTTITPTSTVVSASSTAIPTPTSTADVGPGGQGDFEGAAPQRLGIEVWTWVLLVTSWLGCVMSDWMSFS